MSTIWTDQALIRTTNRAAANAAAALIDHDVGGAKTFDTAAGARPKGSNSTTPAVWYKHTWLTGVRRPETPDHLSGKELIEELLSAGPYPHLNAIGLTNEKIAGLKSVMQIEVIARVGVPQKSLAQFADEHGEELIPVNVTGGAV